MPLPYCDFRTGLTFRDVYWMVAARRWKSRHTVLGKWHEVKLAMYHEYLETAAAAEAAAPAETSNGGNYDAAV